MDQYTTFLTHESVSLLADMWPTLSPLFKFWLVELGNQCIWSTALVGCSAENRVQGVCWSISATRCSNNLYVAEMCTPVSTSVNWSHLRSATHGDLTVPRSRTTRYGQRCFTVSGPTLCNTAVDRVWPITDTDSVLCAVEDCAILQNLWNTAMASQWQLNL